MDKSISHKNFQKQKSVKIYVYKKETCFDKKTSEKYNNSKNINQNIEKKH